MNDVLTSGAGNMRWHIKERNPQEKKKKKKESIVNREHAGPELWWRSRPLRHPVPAPCCQRRVLCPLWQRSRQTCCAVSGNAKAAGDTGLLCKEICVYLLNLCDHGQGNASLPPIFLRVLGRYGEGESKQQTVRNCY